MISIPYRCLSYLTGNERDLRPGMHGLMPLLLQRISEPVSVIAAVGEYPAGLGQIVEQGSSPDVTADLASRNEEAQRAAVCISRRAASCSCRPWSVQSGARDPLFYPGGRAVGLR